jgi:hypothetical protein
MLRALTFSFSAVAILASALLVSTVPASSARADSAQGPDHCPGLSGPYIMECRPDAGPDGEGSVCVPHRCSTDAECYTDERCAELPLCFEHTACETAADGGVEALIGKCDSHRDCAGNAVCKTQKLCITRQLEEDDGCAVREPGSHARLQAGALLWLGVLGGALARRRTRRAKRGS